jgi:hypothetical protein
MKDRLAKERDAEYAAIPLETKQRFLDLFNSGKMNLGEAARAAGISTFMAAQVILKNAVELFPTKVLK